MDNIDFIEKARSYVGVPFRHQGRSRQTGVDCVGLAACAGRDVGIIFNDFTDYGIDPQPSRMRDILENKVGVLEKVSIKDLKPGDLLYMRFTNVPQHIAIYTENNTIIHSYYNVGKVVEHRLDDMWRKRIVSVYRIRRE